MSKTKFPTTEAEVLFLANELTSGLTNNTTIYPAPPVATTDLTSLSSALTAAQSALTEAKALSEAATSAKLAALEAMAEAMKKDLRYAENTVNYDDEKLKLLGWSGRKSQTPMAAPGQTLELVVVEQGEGWVTLAWKKPISGGTVSVYKIYRRQRPAGSWMETAASIEREYTLTDQTRGTEWEYRVVASNKAGDGMASNIVLAVL
jgi:multidrug efflux pump subunit AcrA (membrane-fusion protein)